MTFEEKVLGHTANALNITKSGKVLFAGSDLDMHKNIINKEDQNVAITLQCNNQGNNNNNNNKIFIIIKYIQIKLCT